MDKEFVIENVTAFEREKICNSPDADDITWYPDDLLEIDNVNIVVEGTESDIHTLLQIMGRNTNTDSTVGEGLPWYYKPFVDAMLKSNLI